MFTTVTCCSVTSIRHRRSANHAHSKVPNPKIPQTGLKKTNHH